MMQNKKEMINFDFPQFMPKKKKEEPLFVPVGTQTTTPAVQLKDNTISNFIPALSESARKFTAGGLKGLFSKEPAPTWKEAGKQLLESAEQANRTKGVVSLNGEKREINAINPLAFLSTEPLKKIINPNLTTKFLEYAKSKTTLSRQEITDFAKRPELKKGEADMLNKLAKDLPEGKLPAQEFADSIRRDLLELKPVKVKDPQYKNTTIDSRDYSNPNLNQGENMRRLSSSSRNKNYEEAVFESPIPTNGSSHYPNSKNYFAHARGDEVVESGKGLDKSTKIWREQEIQSDLLQKDNLKNSIEADYRQRYGDLTDIGIADQNATIGKLDPFTNDRFGERIMRERIKEKAQKGYEKYRLPTGETIGKIEGFESSQFYSPFKNEILNADELKKLKVGEQLEDVNNSNWIITDILGEGRFKAVPKQIWQEIEPATRQKTYGSLSEKAIKQTNSEIAERAKETFDLTGKSNPQYRRYSDWGKFLKNKFGGKEVIDPQGNSWMEIDLKPEQGKMPVEAFGIGAIPFMPQVQQLFVPQDEEKKTFTSFMLKERGNFEYNAPKEQKFPFPSSLIQRELKGFTGTNYDPMDPKQNRPGATPENIGIGADLVRMDESMVASSRKNDGITANLRLGTIIYIPELNKKFLVADLMNEKFNGMNKIDFVTLGKKSEIIPKFNKNFTIKIVREGKGYGDARQLVESGEWEKIKNESNDINLR